MDKNKILSWSFVAQAAVLISMIVLFAPVNAGVCPEEGRSIGDATNGTSAIIGETNLSFVNNTGTSIPEGYLINWEDSSISYYFNRTFNSDEEKPQKGLYKVTDTMFVVKTNISFASPKLEVKTKVCNEEFAWVTKRGNITFEADTNLDLIKGDESNNITYKLLDPDDVQLHNVGNISLSNINVGHNGKNSVEINTANLKTGMYTLSIETDPATNNGLDVEGPTVYFDVKNIGVTVEAKPEEQAVTEEIVFTISTTPNTNISLNVTRGVASSLWFKKGEGTGEIRDVNDGHSAFGISDKYGNFKAVASFTDTGDYDITVTEQFVYTERLIVVKITEYEIKLIAPTEGVYHIGEDLPIRGTSNVGDNMLIKIDGSIFKEDAIFDVDYYWSTEEATPGTYKIEMWVLPLSDPENDCPDASVSIMLIRGGLFAKTSSNFVAQGDDFTIEGTVPGRDRVDILTIAPKGGSGKGLAPDDILNETGDKLYAPGLTHFTCGITGENFKKDKIKVNVDTDTGVYLIAVLNYGQDRTWGNSGSCNLLSVISNNYTTALKLKTADQILAILKEKTINAAGSDDLLDVATINVENGFVTLDDIEDVLLNESVTVNGITNRKVGESVIVTVSGLGADATDFKPKTATVEADDKIIYNKFSVSFDAASAKIGAYTVTADDEDGHYDTTTVNIVLAVEPSINVTAAHIPNTSMPTLEPESTNATPDPAQRQIPASKVTKETAAEKTATEEQPGFESVFTVAGLLIATWLMLWMRLRRDKK